MAGLPPLFGFIGKELIYKSALDVEGFSAIVFNVIAVLSKAAAVAVAGIVCIKPFFLSSQSETENFKKLHDPPPGMLMGPLILGILGLIFGIWPEVNLAFFLSLVSLALGLSIYFGWKKIFPMLQVLFRKAEPWGPAPTYENGIGSMLALAKIQTQILERGSVGSYLAVIFLFVVFSSIPFLITDSGFLVQFKLPDMNYIEWSIITLITIASIFILFATSLLSVFVALGVIGYSVALIYVLYGAPDLAITQIFVETLTIVIATLIISKIPDLPTISGSKVSLLRNAIIAVAFGLTVTTLLSFTVSQNFNSHLSRYFSQQSVPGGFGRNIVNVILVDFRALDTFGEITVVAVAALGIHALLKHRPKSGENGNEFDHTQNDQ